MGGGRGNAGSLLPGEPDKKRVPMPNVFQAKTPGRAMTVDTSRPPIFSCDSWWNPVGSARFHGEPPRPFFHRRIDSGDRIGGGKPGPCGRLVLGSPGWTGG